MSQKATVGDLYRYLQQYSKGNLKSSLFDYILRTTVVSIST